MDENEYPMLFFSDSLTIYEHFRYYVWVVGGSTGWRNKTFTVTVASNNSSQLPPLIYQ